MNKFERQPFKKNFECLVHEIRVSNRHFVQNPIVGKILDLVQDHNQYDVITEQSPLFRARDCNIDDYEKLNLKPEFEGFDENESGAAPVSLCKENRANGKGIRRLYVAEDFETAVAEIKPLLDNMLSVAEMYTTSPFAVLDIAKPLEDTDSPDERDYLRQLINMQFAVSCSGDSDGYSFTQWFSDLVESLGYGENGKINNNTVEKRGIRYSSATHLQGKNIVIFASRENSGRDPAYNFGVNVVNSKICYIRDVKYVWGSVKP